MPTAARSTEVQHNWGQVPFFSFLRMMTLGSGCSKGGSQYKLSTREGNCKEQPKNTRVSQSTEPRQAGPRGRCGDHMKEHLGAHTSAEKTGQHHGGSAQQLKAVHGLGPGLLPISYVTSAEPLPSRTEIPALLSHASVLLYNQFYGTAPQPPAPQVEVLNAG